MSLWETFLIITINRMWCGNEKCAPRFHFWSPGGAEHSEPLPQLYFAIIPRFFGHCSPGRWLSRLTCSPDEEKWWFRAEEFPKSPGNPSPGSRNSFAPPCSFCSRLPSRFPNLNGIRTLLALLVSFRLIKTFSSPLSPSYFTYTWALNSKHL